MGESRGAYVYAAIVRGILAGTYQPGQALNRREIAGALGVSISPVNEAFAVLQNEGIVQTLPRKGTFLVELDRRALAELTVVRAALEVEAARHSCGERISAHSSEMLELAGRVDAAQPVTYEHLHADVVFHRALVALAGNRVLASVFDTVIARSLLLAMEASPAAHGKPSFLSHRRFVRDLCRANRDSVAPIVRRNIYSGKESFLEPQSFDVEAGEPGSPLDVVLNVLEEARS